MNDKQDLQIERIKHMESLLDKALELVDEVSDLKNKLDSLSLIINELSDYYDSPLWQKDYKDDENGLIPSNLKRGVLSEDAVYNLLSDVDDLYYEIEAMTKAIK